jgi:hypothetical protein
MLKAVGIVRSLHNEARRIQHFCRFDQYSQYAKLSVASTYRAHSIDTAFESAAVDPVTVLCKQSHR